MTARLVGEVRSNGTEPTFRLVPKLWRLDGITRMGVLYCHGAGTLGADQGSAADGLKAVLAALAERWPLGCADLGGAFTWGNATARTAVGTEKTAIQSAGAASGKVALVGGSMGAATALNFARANPTLVASVSLILPAVDLNDIHDNNRGGYAASINAAVGGDPSAVANSSPAGADWTGVSIPMKAWYASDDAIVIASTVTTFMTARSGTAVNVGALGHTDAAIAAVPPSDVVDFIAANP